MPVAPLLTEEELDALRQFDTCMVANAIESFRVRLCNTGFADASIRCMFPDAPPMVGYAATARLRSGEPPIVGGTFHDRADFWNSILEVPAPRILVLEDMDDQPGRGGIRWRHARRHFESSGVRRLFDERRRARIAFRQKDGH